MACASCAGCRLRLLRVFRFLAVLCAFGSVMTADAGLRQVEAQLADVRGQLDQDVRNALLDLKSSSDQVEVAQSSVMGDENVIAAILNGMRTLDARPVESELRGVR